ncbi:thymidylate synthase [Acanthamoeba castellanii medusavirus]|uniref:thymidylate synthase n=1 Tax=Acanthamoeba castellanii medusavirus J1 TaxID=3114988 RepID=A0A3T1CX58_9VIRU|nr:thymidylate synthase [Acanthamoeba castellanii medusavirus]BBI30404.1 thymidylate synthase [Acanthamoeba castellanii medusavirus J1]
MTEGEQGYLDLVKLVLERGEHREDERTGRGTISVFSPPKLIFENVGQRFPLLTTKRVFWRGVIEELLWFLRGSTDSKELEAKGINIWRANTTREFLDNRGLHHLPEGSIGAGYGHQWRKWGAKCGDESAILRAIELAEAEDAPNESDYPETNAGWDKFMSDSYAWSDRVHNTSKALRRELKELKKPGIDQITEAIRLIREDPGSRRIIVSAWNVSDLDKAALPPCHAFFQFHVSADHKRLDLLMTQRSADIGLGLPFNIASYAALLCIIANITEKEAGHLTISIGDAHIYSNHVDAMKEQAKRAASADLPMLTIKRTLASIDDNLKAEDFEIQNYHPQKSIKMEMAV